MGAGIDVPAICLGLDEADPDVTPFRSMHEDAADEGARDGESVPLEEASG